MNADASASLLAATLVCFPAWAATIEVGPSERYTVPSAGIAAAQPGDTVHLAPATYFDCVAWRTDRLTIDGPGAAFSDRTCQGKSVFIVSGADTIVRGITFTHVRVPDRNGAGIRLEGGSLTVEDCTFDDAEAGIVAGDIPDAELIVRRSVFRHVGAPGASLSAVTTGQLAALRLEGDRFVQPRGEGGALRTAAPATIVGSEFQAGASPWPLIEASGPLEISSATFRLDGVRPTAILATGPMVRLHRLTLENHAGAPATLLVDWTSAGAELDGNEVGRDDREATRRGLSLARIKAAAHVTIDSLRHVAGRLRRAVP